jgi:short-subunit dehydrogenase
MSTPSCIYVSGATGYLGKRVIVYLLEQGRRVLIGGRDSMELNRLRGVLDKKHPEKILGTVVTDLSDPSQWDQTSKELDNFQINGYVNCSGVQGAIGLVSDLEVRELSRVLNINLISAVYFTKHFLSKSAKKDKISIIHFSGGGASSSRPFFNSYSLSKTALVRFVENVANEFEEIKINAIAPGIMPSDMQSQILQSELLINSKEHTSAKDSMESVKDNIASDTTVLRLVEYLLSDTSDGISGKLISAKWDNWVDWNSHLDKLRGSDLYTLRRITARDRGESWGDL